MHLIMTDEQGSVIASGSGAQFLTALSGETSSRQAPIMKSWAELGGVIFGNEIPLLKAHGSENQFDVAVARLQAEYPRCKVLELLDYLGVTQ